MSKFELFLIISAVAIPFVTLLIMLPKKLFKKKEKSAKPEQKAQKIEEVKPEQPKLEKTEESPKKPKEINTFNSEISTDEFKSYLDHRPSFEKPKRIEHDNTFEDKSMPYIPRQRRRREKSQPKTVAEEIRSLSPELKALIITGALDKKF